MPTLTEENSQFLQSGSHEVQCNAVPTMIYKNENWLWKHAFYKFWETNKWDLILLGWDLKNQTPPSPGDLEKPDPNAKPALVIPPENFIMIRWWEHSEKGVTDRRLLVSMNKPTTWCKSGRVSLVSSSCLYKTQPDGRTDRQKEVFYELLGRS